MQYLEYTFKSIQIFILCFLLGTFVDTQFHRYQNTIKNPNKLLIGLLQLIVIISITYLLHSIQFLEQFFEEYTPNVLFSSFLLSLQSNMIYNFKSAIKYEY